MEGAENTDYSIRWEGKGVYVQMGETVVADDILSVTSTIAQDERFDNLRYQIVDFRTTKELELSVQDVEHIAAMDRAMAISNPRICLAIVTTDETLQALASWYQTVNIHTPWEPKIFLTLSEARSWAKE